MERDEIALVEIDDTGRLHVVPAHHTFPYIYREAMEVHWDTARGSLHSPKPRQWSYAQWFSHILAAAREQGCELYATGRTQWRNVSQATLQPAPGDHHA